MRRETFDEGESTSGGPGRALEDKDGERRDLADKECVEIAGGKFCDVERSSFMEGGVEDVVGFAEARRLRTLLQFVMKISNMTVVLILYTYCLPTVVSVRSLTFRPCAARCLVKGVLSCIPLNNFGENTSKGSDTVCVSSTTPSLMAYCQQTAIFPESFTNSVVSKSVNFNRKMPGTRTLTLAKVQRAATRPSSSRSFSGV